MKLYRGDSEKISQFDFNKTYSHCLVGQGIYLTDNIDVANTYRTKGCDFNNVAHLVKKTKHFGYGGLDIWKAPATIEDSRLLFWHVMRMSGGSVHINASKLYHKAHDYKIKDPTKKITDLTSADIQEYDRAVREDNYLYARAAFQLCFKKQIESGHYSLVEFENLARNSFYSTDFVGFKIEHKYTFLTRDNEYRVVFQKQVVPIEKVFAPWIQGRTTMFDIPQIEFNRAFFNVSNIKADDDFWTYCYEERLGLVFNAARAVRETGLALDQLCNQKTFYKHVSLQQYLAMIRECSSKMDACAAPFFRANIWVKLREYLEPYGYRGFEYAGGVRTGSFRHRAFCCWHDEWLNSFIVDKLR